MLRTVISTVLMAGALVAGASEQKHSVDGAWVFDNAPSFPGVTMLEMTTHGGRTTGNVTTAWYGPMTLQNAKVEGNVVTFDLRNPICGKQQIVRWVKHDSPCQRMAP